MWYVCFMDLTSCRGNGGYGEGPISWLTIDQYADAKGFEDEQREDLHFFMTRLDACYLEFKLKKIKENNKPGIVGADGKKMAR